MNETNLHRSEYKFFVDSRSCIYWYICLPDVSDIRHRLLDKLRSRAHDGSASALNGEVSTSQDVGDPSAIKLELA